MAKTKRGFILATCFFSGAAAILSFVTLGTEDWVTSPAVNGDDNNSKEKDSITVGLFSGVFIQTTAQRATYQLTMVCLFEFNICALLCGDNMEDNLKRLYHNMEPSPTDVAQCSYISDSYDYHAPRVPFLREPGDNSADKIFINAGAWLSTIIFIAISGSMGVLSAILAVWNTAGNPSKPYNVLGLYIYNSIAFFSVLLAIVLWAIIYVKDFLKNIPTYKTFLEGFSTYGYAHLGYSYWMNLGSLFLYIVSLSLLYFRNYLISKESKMTRVATEDDNELGIRLR